MKILAVIFLSLALISCGREGFKEEAQREKDVREGTVSSSEASEASKEEEKPAEEIPLKEEPEKIEGQEEIKNEKEEEEIISKEQANPCEGIDMDSKFLILVNKDHLIPDDYTVDLTPVQGYQMATDIVEPFLDMQKAAKKDGVDLLLCYGYRTKEQSEKLFQKQINQQLQRGLSQEEAVIEAAKWVAPPGTSEHHTGYALDIVTPTYQVLNHGFKDTDAGKWMKENAHNFGFILRFPENKEDITKITFEPWHYRYVGIEAATYIYENDLCLEEFLEGAE